MNPQEPEARQLAELVALLRDHPGAGLVHEPTGWSHALDVVKAHLDNRKRDHDFRVALIDKLGRFFPAGEYIEDWMLLNLIHELVQHADKTTGSEP